MATLRNANTGARPWPPRWLPRPLASLLTTLGATDSTTPSRAATQPLGDQPMAHFNNENFTLFEEEEFNLHFQVFASLLIITKFAPCLHTPQEVPVLSIAASYSK